MKRNENATFFLSHCQFSLCTGDGIIFNCLICRATIQTYMYVNENIILSCAAEIQRLALRGHGCKLQFLDVCVKFLNKWRDISFDRETRNVLLFYRVLRIFRNT